MRIAVMTGGGDCPGLNAVIQAIVKRASEKGHETLGVFCGYAGLLDGNIKPLSLEDVKDIYQVGGTILETSRTNPFKTEEGPKKVMDTLEKFGIDALIAIGGEDTLGTANKLSKLGVPVVGVPKTVDNDLSYTDYSIGFQTAVEIASEEISRLHSTAKSHERVMIAEVMGRHAGWLTLMSGLAGGAHIILVPEQDIDINSVCDTIKERENAGKKYTVIAVAEGAKVKNINENLTASSYKDEFGHVRMVTRCVAEVLEKEIEERTGKSTRSVVLGHVQRGGPPNAFDRVFGIRLGIAAVDMVDQKKFGEAAVLQGTEIVPIKLDKVVEKLKTLRGDLIELTKFFSMM